MTKNNQLIDASRDGKLLDVIECITMGADVHFLNEFALRLACTNGHLEVVKYLVSQEANIHISNGLLLTIAIQYGHLEVVKFLVYNGINIHAYSCYNYALLLATEYGTPSIVEFLKNQFLKENLKLIT